MPIYDYQCVICEAVQEEWHKMDQSPRVTCIECGSECERVLSAPAVVIPPQHQACGSKLKYYGVKNIVTGEGITKNTNVSQPPGIHVKKRG